MALNDTLSIDIARRGTIHIPAKQADHGYDIICTILRNGENIVDSSTDTATFRVGKPDNTFYYGDATVNSDGTVSIHVDDEGQMLAVPGYAVVDVTLNDGNGAVKSTQNFVLDVQAAPGGEAIPSSSVFIELQELVAEAEAAIPAVPVAVEAANAATLAANTAAGTANTAAAAANTAANTANQAASRSARLLVERGTLDSGAGGTTSSTTMLRSSFFFASTDAVALKFNSLCEAKVFCYDVDGQFLGCYDGETLSKDWRTQHYVSSPIDLAVYAADTNSVYFRFVFRNKSTSVVLNKEDLDAEIIVSAIKAVQNSGSESGYVDYGAECYVVGANGDFETFTEMLRALKNNVNAKTVYVKSGTYDIFNEIGGAEYIASIDITGKTWRDFSDIVPANTTIIGLGTVILSWNPTDSEIIDRDHAFLFSPLNVSGNCVIKNITINCSNCRYGIHDEYSSMPIYIGTTHEFENVKINRTQTSLISSYAYGSGHGPRSVRRFKNCIFKHDTYDDVWSTHDWPVSNNGDNSNFVFENCSFICDANSSGLGNLRFSVDVNQNTKMDQVTIVGCDFSEIYVGSSGSTERPQTYDFTMYLCKPHSLSYSSAITEASKIAPKQFLSLPA